MRHQLKHYLKAGGRQDIGFVLDVLDNYEGKPLVNDLCMDVIELLDLQDRLLDKVSNVLTPHGLFPGTFGMFEALKQKKSEMESWLHDGRETVRIFAIEHIRRLNEMAATAQRSAEESIALSKLDHGEDVSDD